MGRLYNGWAVKTILEKFKGIRKYVGRKIGR